MIGAGDRPVRTVSLRRRVAVSVLVLLVVVLTSLGLIVNLLLRNALTADLKTRLEDRAGYASLLQQQGVTGQSLADKLFGAGIASTFTSGQGHFVGQDTDEPGQHPRPGGQPPARPAVTAPISYSEVNGQLTATVTLADGTLSLSTSESEIDRTLSELRRIELLAGAATLLVAGLVLFYLVGAALRPLSRMTELARRIRDGARGGRLRPTKPNTDLGRTAVAIDEMLDALEAAESQAQRAELRMRQFLADASHDLRTPLAGVIAGSEQLLRTPLGRAEREARLVAVVRQARRAARLVDDLLLMTRLDAAGGRDDPTDSGTATRTPIDPAAVLLREIESLRLRRPDLQVQVAAGPPVTVAADADALHRALGNILDNAGRASPRGGTIRVGWTVDEGRVRIGVSDDGPGVPTSAQERIFDRFVRLADARQGDGSGLGLPISRAILRAHGGDVRCLPSASGARFEVDLPVTTTAPSQVPAPPSAPRQFAHR